MRAIWLLELTLVFGKRTFCLKISATELDTKFTSDSTSPPMDDVQPPAKPVCRLCLEAPSGMTLLNSNAHFIESIRQITTVEVLMLDPHYSIYMCADCQEALEQCIRFRDRCLQNDDIFRRTYQLESGVVKVEQEEAAGTLAEIKFEMIVTPDLKDDPYEDDEDDGGAADEDDEDWEAKPKVVSERVPKKRGRKKKVVVEEPEEKPIPKKRGRKKRVLAPGEEPPKKESAVRMEQCQHCGKLMKSTALRAHLSTHNPDRTRFECPYCPKIFYHSRQLKNHVNCSHTHEQTFSCDQCGKTYERSDSLKKHYIAEHTDEKRYECKECGMRFARSTSRLYHFQMVHQVGRPHQCEYCDKSFKRKADIILHTRTHTGEKPFKCDICFKAFSKSYNVVIHKKSHRNDAAKGIGLPVGLTGPAVGGPLPPPPALPVSAPPGLVGIDAGSSGPVMLGAPGGMA